jgi:pimeloyl-ACP methyl ester carboxylesterase
MSRWRETASPGDPRAIDQVQTFWELLLCYEELLRGLGLDRPAAVGQAYGGMVAADLAANFPLLFSRLVPLSPLGLWRDDAPIPSGAPRSSPGPSPTMALAAGCTGSPFPRLSPGAARTRLSLLPTRRSSAARSRAAGLRSSTTAVT